VADADTKSKYDRIKVLLDRAKDLITRKADHSGSFDPTEHKRLIEEIDEILEQLSRSREGA
jgi:hypothetical protein